MKSELMKFEGKSVEVFEFNGLVLFNPKHVAECLDIKNVNDNLRKMNNKQVVKLTNSKIGDTDFRKLHNTGENFLTEGGVYKLIFKSKKKEAEKFQDWVTDEVLPQIRQTGGYIPLEDDDSESDIMAKALLIAQKTLDKKDKIINDLKPKAEGFEQFINTENLYKWNVVAKNLGIGRNTMLEILRGQKILMTDIYIDRNGKERRGENHNVPYQPYMKYFDVKFNIVNNNRRCATVLVKASGQDYLRKKLTKLGYIHNVA